MTKSVYIVGGAGTGKSTFMSQLLSLLLFGDPDSPVGEAHLGPLEEFHTRPNAKVVVTLRGHRIGHDGLYLGRMRDEFPGTDGLDRATSPTGKEWLELGKHEEFDYIVGEGATLATRPFLDALAAHTELFVIHLTASPEVVAERCAARGSKQDERFLLATVTRSANLADYLTDRGVRVLTIDSADFWETEMALDLASEHLES